MRHSGAESAGYLLFLRAMISFNVKLRVAGTGAATGAGSGVGSGTGSGSGSRSGTGSGSGSGCPSGKLIKYSSTVWSRTNSGSTQTETSRAISVTRRPDAAAMFERS